MDAGPVSEGKSSSSWKLAPAVAEKTQGLVVTGFGTLNFGRALFLQLGDGVTNGSWLDALARVAPVTSAVPPAPGERPTRATALALSWVALARMGLDETALASFSRPFREGMFQEDRLRRLGDRRGDDWLSTVVPGGPLWSANTPLRESARGLTGAFDVSDGADAEVHVTTPVSVHALLLLYAASDEDAKAWCAQVSDALKPLDVTIVRDRALFVDAEQHSGISREHFGFADGLSQPAPFDRNGAVIRDGVAVAAPAPVQGIPLGEVLFGYVDGHDEPAPGPVVPQELDGKPGNMDPRPKEAGLDPHPDAEGFFDLGLNGSYMVVRELKQDVASFWQSMDANAARIRAQDPQHTAHVTADWIAERAVGRDRQGHLLCPGGLLAPVNGQPDNDYEFWERDRFGHGCPVGSHVRRAFPRDALAPDKASRPSLLKAANNHRILRRGRKFGPPIAHDRVDDGVDRGLLFMCLNTDIARQFEFIQQTWLLNTTFATLYQEQDPLIGVPGPMTVRERAADPAKGDEQQLRRIVHVDTYIQMVGGDYFFLPSLPALRYLARL